MPSSWLFAEIIRAIGFANGTLVSLAQYNELFTHARLGG